MVQNPSTMLVKMFDEELDAPARMNLAQLANSIEPSSFMYGQNWHEFLQVHVQTCSEMLHDHDSNKKNGFDVRKLKFLLREIFD